MTVQPQRRIHARARRHAARTAGHQRRARGLLASAALLVVTVSGQSGQARAQIVNVQPSTSAQTPAGLSTELQATLNWATGNTSFLELGGSGRLTYRYYDHVAFVLLSGKHKVVSDTVYASRTFEHLRYRYQIVDWLAVEAFAQHEFNQFGRLWLRVVTGLGPRCTVYSNGTVELIAAAAYMFEIERLAADDLDDASQLQLNHRLSTYLLATVDVTDALALTHTTYVQPRFDAIDDFRLLSQTALVVQGARWLAVQLAFSLAYDARPPLAVKGLDTALETSLLVRL